MEVAAVLGVSTGAMMGAGILLALMLNRRQRSKSSSAAPMEGPWRSSESHALVPACKVPRMDFAEARAARSRFNREVISLRQELELCRAGDACCESLRSRHRTQEVQQHIYMLVMIGKRLGLDSSLIAALPEMVWEVRSSSPAAMNVLATLEACLREHAISLEQRLCEMSELCDSFNFDSTTSESARGSSHQVLHEIHKWKEAPETTGTDSDEDSKRGDFPEMKSEELPCFVQFWQEQSSSLEEDLGEGKRKHPTERRGGKKRSATEMEEATSPTEKVLVYLLNHGSAEDMSAIKGLTRDDIKEVLLHRRNRQGDNVDLEMLPLILRRKISIQKLIKDNE